MPSNTRGHFFVGAAIFQEESKMPEARLELARPEGRGILSPFGASRCVRPKVAISRYARNRNNLAGSELLTIRVIREQLRMCGGTPGGQVSDRRSRTDRGQLGLLAHRDRRHAVANY